ncbi:MAG: hypothetical protein NVS9B4_20750 [Candidatus Acidiferrum sp.]
MEQFGGESKIMGWEVRIKRHSFERGTGDSNEGEKRSGFRAGIDGINAEESGKLRD